MSQELQDLRSAWGDFKTELNTDIGIVVAKMSELVAQVEALKSELASLPNEGGEIAALTVEVRELLGQLHEKVQPVTPA